ncbi:MAG: glycosyltransferase family 4 protein [Chloroflexi bacterium]|nr:glycosyltransferase family 4 protein [Chloroflexota bacterium]
MRIGIDASRVPTTQRPRTGTETYSRELIARLLPLLTRAGHQVLLYTPVPLTPEHFGLTAWPSRVHTEVIPLPRLWTHVGLGSRLWRDPPDVLFIPAHVVPILPPRGVPILVTVHDLGYEHEPEAHPRLQRAYLRWSTRHSASHARVVLADSRATAQDLTRWYHIPESKIRVLYPGFSPPPSPSPARIQAVRQRYGLTEPYFLFVGTLHPRKNVHRLLDAFAQVKDVPLQVEQARSAGPVHLVLAGRVGWKAQGILARGQAPDLRSRVHMLGYVPDEDLPPLMAGATALVFPSLYEGFGFPVLEAQALRVPVLTSDVASLPEVAGQGALYVDPHQVRSIADGMRRLLEDPALRRRLVQEGERNVGRFSWDRSARQVWHLMEEVGKRR